MPVDFLLDRARRVLLHEDTAFDPVVRRWISAAHIAGEPIGLREGVRWLQMESGNGCRVPVAVIGPREASTSERRAAFEVGAGLAALGIALLCGGKGGVMEAACEGAASRDGVSIGLLPDPEPQAANPFVTIPLATGIGEARNAIIARAALALVAIGSSYGTVSEIALGLQFGRPVLSLLNSAPIAGTRALTTVKDALDAVCRIVLALP
ncbi:MAG: TIGR00725 family protein [Alphaproteobacteria bacterium]|nr:TIGR00725 family protein [Alphaproteobacteria bacterium]MBV9152159.1 TIGR00725 family protein [Alphaproteobacteria bacterium]